MVPRKMLAALLIWILLSPPGAIALSCAPDERTPQQLIEESSLVFEGMVTGGKPLRPGELDPSEIAVTTVHKGSLTREVTLQLSSGWDSLALKKGETYLFIFEETDYAPEDGTITRSLCHFRSFVATSSGAYGAYAEHLPNRGRFIDRPRPTSGSSRFEPRMGVLVALAVLAIVIAWRLFGRNGSANDG